MHPTIQPQPSAPRSPRASVKLQFRVEQALAKRVKQAASDAELTDSEWLRRLIDRALPRAA